MFCSSLVMSDSWRDAKLLLLHVFSCGFFSVDCNGCFVLTKTDSSHNTIVLVVMLKESDLMSNTVIGAEAFGCFFFFFFFSQWVEHSDWSGLCSERMGSRPQEREVKGEVSSWKSRARDLKKQNKKRGGRGLHMRVPHEIPSPGKCVWWRLFVDSNMWHALIFIYFSFLLSVNLKKTCNTCVSRHYF